MHIDDRRIRYLEVLRIAARDRLCESLTIAARDQRVSSIWNEALPCVCQFDSAPATDEELDSELCFQLLDVPRNSRLVHVQPAGRTREVQLLADRHHTPILDQLSHR